MVGVGVAVVVVVGVVVGVGVVVAVGVAVGVAVEVEVVVVVGVAVEVVVEVMDTKRFILRDSSIRDRLIVWLNAQQLDAEKPLEAIFRPYKKNRSLAQNSLMWMWLGIIANHLRDEHGLKTNSEDLKAYFQSLYLGMRNYEDPDGQLGVRHRGTSELKAHEFTEFLNRIDVYAGSELGLRLPHPEDLYYEAMQNQPRIGKGITIEGELA